MSLATAFLKIESFVKREVKGIETFVEKVEAVEKKVAPELADVLAEAKKLYTAAKASVPVVEADIAIIAEIIAELETL